MRYGHQRFTSLCKFYRELPFWWRIWIFFVIVTTLTIFWASEVKSCKSTIFWPKIKVRGVFQKENQGRFLVKYRNLKIHFPPTKEAKNSICRFLKPILFLLWTSKYEFWVHMFLLSILDRSEALHIMSFAKIKKTYPDSLQEWWNQWTSENCIENR